MGRKALTEEEKKQKVFFRLSPNRAKKLNKLINQTGETRTKVFESALDLYYILWSLETRADAEVRDALSRLEKIETMEQAPSMALFYDPLIEKIHNVLTDIKRVHPKLESVKDRELAYNIILPLTLGAVILSGLHGFVMAPIWQMEYEDKRGEAWEKREKLKMELGMKSELEGWQKGKFRLKRSEAKSMDIGLPSLEELEADIRRLEAMKAKRKGVKKE